MRPTYQATLRGDRLEWHGEPARRLASDKPITVYVTIVEDDEARITRDPERGERMAAILEQIAQENSLEMDDPVSWERETRQDRSLPGRE